MNDNIEVSHQSEHFFFGFIFEPIGQLNACANCSKLANGMLIRNFAGLCSSSIIFEYNLVEFNGFEQ